MVAIDALTMLTVLFLSRALVFHLQFGGLARLFLVLASSARQHECPSHLIRLVIEAAPYANGLP